MAAAPSFANVATAAVSRPMSLKEIQAEELRSKHSSQPAAAPVPSPSPAAAAAAPVSAPQAPSKNSSSSAGSPVKKVVQVSVAPSPSPARVPAPAPPPVSVAAADDDDMVWDYSPKPVVKPPSRHVFSSPPLLSRIVICFARANLSCLFFTVLKSKSSRRKERDSPKSLSKMYRLLQPHHLVAPACQTSSRCGARLKCSR